MVSVATHGTDSRRMQEVCGESGCGNIGDYPPQYAGIFPAKADRAGWRSVHCAMIETRMLFPVTREIGGTAFQPLAGTFYSQGGRMAPRHAFGRRRYWPGYIGFALRLVSWCRFSCWSRAYLPHCWRLPRLATVPMRARPAASIAHPPGSGTALTWMLASGAKSASRPSPVTRLSIDHTVHV